MTTSALVLATTCAPLTAFAMALLFLMRRPRLAQALVLAASAVSLASAMALLARGPVAPVRHLWLATGDLALRFGFLLDGLSLMLGVVVALITLCVMVYSLGYMAHDPGRTRYFAMLALFEWSMLSFVYAVDLLQAFVFWELVGLASFFLIGFWYQKPAATAAAKKAFVMTRVGDVGLLIAVLWVGSVAGHFDIPGLLDAHRGLATLTAPSTLTAITLLMFVGIAGKSAQFPLHTWLPDAMEGPTPVSALLHSATMVAAGVFLMARLHPLFLASPTTSGVVLAVAAFTALLAATCAMVAADIKRVLAYSSISQLGFMLMGLSAGDLFAGVFHLVTHALFKALLFLCAGLLIHRFETNDMVAIGRAGGRQPRFATAGLGVGAAALAGVPPLSGFYSKEAIFGALGSGGGALYVAAALAAAFLTAYYAFRMVFLVTRPADGVGAGSQPGTHEATEPWTMAAPVAVLTALAIVAGVWGADIAAALGVEAAHHGLAAAAPALGAVLSGVALAWADYGRTAAPRTGFVARVPAVQRLFAHGWYVDAFYGVVVVRLTRLTASLLQVIERKLDGGANRFGRAMLDLGTASTRLHSGRVQLYSGCAVLLVGVAALWFGAF